MNTTALTLGPVRLAPALSRATCESLTHGIDESVPAAHMLLVNLTPDIVADVNLCAACAEALT